MALKRDLEHSENGTPCTVDFETRAIGPRPLEYPPEPVGVAIRTPSGKTKYLAWGHPSGNNCTFDEARAELWQWWNTSPILMHNAAFDLEVAHRWLGFNAPREWHDTYFILFLALPHRDTYSLKPTAEALLGDPPDEQHAMRDWAVKNLAGVTPKNFGAHISRCPVDLVAPYAVGDVDRTFKLYQRYWAYVRDNMQEAYDRERRLLPHLINASRRGIRVDRALLNRWDGRLTGAMAECDQRIYGVFGATFNIDSNDDLADMIESEKLLRPEGWILTETGRRSTAKAALIACVQDPGLVRLLIYRNTVATLQRTFVRRWETDSAVDGRLHCQWHQTRSDDGGTRTGRIASSTPNLANVPNPQDRVEVPEGLPPLPNLRKALLPEEGHLWLSADYSGQELRVMAHFEGGALQEAYIAMPTLDTHAHAARLVQELTGMGVDRKRAKTIGFAILYGAGNNKLAEQLGATADEAAGLRRAYLQAMPGVAALQRAATQRWESGKPIRTVGGRLVPPQPRELVKGQYRDFAYKALNMLIQGSAADQTKEAICRAGSSGSGLGMLLLSQLYDEINMSVPEDALHESAAVLKEAMTQVPWFDVPFTTDVEVGPSWGTMQPYKEPAR